MPSDCGTLLLRCDAPRCLLSPTRASWCDVGLEAAGRKPGRKDRSYAWLIAHGAVAHPAFRWAGHLRQPALSHRPAGSPRADARGWSLRRTGAWLVLRTDLAYQAEGVRLEPDAFSRKPPESQR